MFSKIFRFGALAGAALVATTTIAAIASPVMAQSVPVLFRDSENNIYVTGRSPQERVTMTYEGMLRGRDYQANTCGAIVLRNSSTNPISGTIKVGGVDVNTATLPTQLLPTCGSNGQFEETRTANFKTSSGDIVIVGRTPGSYVTIQVPQDRDRAAAANACGVVRFANSTSFQHTAATTVSFPMSGYTAPRPIANINERDALLCSRGQLYVPASWLSGS